VSAKPCTVVNLRAAPYEVYIGRPGPFGNPYSVAKHGRDGALELYRAHFAQRIETDAAFRESVAKLAGKSLGCFCKPAACHGDVIAAWVNALEEDE
jgi:hypothetical protein